MKKFTIGAICEFKSAKDYNYLQYAHDTEDRIPLVGVLDLERSTPLKDTSELGEISYLYFAVYHAAVLVRRKLIRHVGTIPVPYQYREFPLLRAAGYIEPTGQVKNWFIYKVPLTFNIARISEPAVRYSVAQLSEEEAKLSLASIIGHETMLDRVNSGWRPQDWTGTPKKVAHS